MATNAFGYAAKIKDQFTPQARGFSESPELHNEAVLSLLVRAANPRPEDRMLDVACGPGTVVAAFSSLVAQSEGLDASEAMLAKANELAQEKLLTNVGWQLGSVYALPYEAATFDIVTCRFAFHHFEDLKAAFKEMLRVASPGARIVVCDAIASDDHEKAEAFNVMERWRDPSTVEFRTLGFFESLFMEAGLESPMIEHFQASYLAHELVAHSFPSGDDGAGLLTLLEDSVEGDLLGMNARRTPDGVYVAFHSVVLSAVKSE
jgi:ubiquinone/menaquinone biosynthesis C-methylase UbiE